MARPVERDVRRTLTGLKTALSRRTFLVAGETSVSAPPMMPATATARRASAMTRSRVVRRRTTSSMVVMASPSSARRTIIFRPESVSRSNACSGWPHSIIT